MGFELTVLGSSSATPIYNRHPSSQYLQIRDHHFLIDCGEGTLMQLIRFRIRYHRISHIFISHLHGDHYLGLMGLLSTFHLQGRNSDLHLYGQQELMDIVEIQLRLSNTQLRYNLIFHPIRPYASEIIYEDDDIWVGTIILNHRIPCTGFLFREKPRPRKLRIEKLNEYQIPFAQYARIKNGEDFLTSEGVRIPNADLTDIPMPHLSYAYCSDTLFMPDLAGLLKGVEVLYHEATFLHDMKDRAVATYHTTAKEAALLAKQSEVRKLLIGHFSARYKQLEPLLEEARSVFSETELALEGQKYRFD